MSDDGDRGDLALGVATLAVVAWAFSPLFVRWVGASTPTVVFWRLWLAQPVMIGAAYASRGRLSWPLLRRSVWPGVLFGTSIVAGFAAVQHTSVANATLIGSLQPALLLMAAPAMFGERTDGRRLGLALVAFGATATLVLAAGETSGASLRGDLYAVVNLLIWTVYFVRVKRLRDEGVHAGSFLASVFLVAAITVTPWALVTGDDLGSVSSGGFFWLMATVLGPGLIGHGAMTWAQRHLDITVSSLLTLLGPVLSTLLAWMAYGERLNGLQLLAGGVVVAALALIMAGVRERTEEAPAALSVVGD